MLTDELTRWNLAKFHGDNSTGGELQDMRARERIGRVLYGPPHISNLGIGARYSTYPGNTPTQS